MSDSGPQPHGYKCGSCGEFHNELPMALALEWPLAVHEVPDDERVVRLIDAGDACILDGARHFVRGCLELPVRDDPRGPFVWGLWVEIDADDYDTLTNEQAGRKSATPILGRLANGVPGYPPTLDLAVHIHQRSLGVRPIVELPPTDHPLAREQHEGIGLNRVHELVADAL